MLRGLISEPWYYDILRVAIVQHIEDNSNKYTFFVGNVKEYLSKLHRNGVKIVKLKYKWDLQGDAKKLAYKLSWNFINKDSKTDIYILENKTNY